MTERSITPSKITAWLDCAHYLTLRHQVDDGLRAAPQTGLVRLLGILGLLINAAIIVLLALKPSNEYFASRRAVPRR